MPAFLHLSWFKKISSVSSVFFLVILLSGLSGQAQQSNLIGNTRVALKNPAFSNLSTDVSGFGNASNLIDSDTSNSSTWAYLIVAGALSGYAEVRDNNATGAQLYQGKTQVGFTIATGAIRVGTTTSISITTYNNSATVVESYTTNLSSLVDVGGGQQKIGFITSLPYNRVRISFTVSGVLGSGSISVLYAAVTKFVAGPALSCNANSAMNQPDFPVSADLSVSSALNLLALVGGISNFDAIVSNSLSDFATINPSLGVLNDSITIAVKDQISDYTNPTFAGFDVSTATLASLSVGTGGNISLRAYLDGVLVDQVTPNNLLVVSDLIGVNRRVIGFVPSGSFDEIRISFKSGSILGVSLGVTNIYGAFFKKFCTGPTLSCNTQTPLNLPAFPVTASTSVVGTAGVLVGGIANVDNVISASTTDFASIDPSVGVLGNSITLAVKDHITDYSYPSFVGFDISSVALANLSLAGNISISAYKDGVLVGTATGGSLLAGASVLSAGNRQIIGFVPNGAVDEVRLTLFSGLIGGVTLGSTNIYSAVFRSFCEGPALACNTLTALDQTQYPVYINAIHTGVSGGVLGVNNNVRDASNVIDNDPNSYATATVLTGALNQVSLSVRKELADFEAGSFAGFEISNTSALLNADLLGDITIKLYKDGNPTPVQTATGPTQLTSVTTSLLGGGSSRMVIGIIAMTDYDEVVISFNNTVTANTGITRIYSFYSQRFCSGTINCNGTYWLNSASPPVGYPVIINGLRTGTTGLACANVNGVELSNPGNVITPSTIDYASIKLAAGVACPVSISVEDILTTYPSGTIAGFAIRNIGSLVEADLFNSITIATYKDGVFQQAVTGYANLLRLELLGSPIFGGGTGTYNVGFATTMPFDEVRISVSSLLNVNPLSEVRVYGAFIDTRNVTNSDGTQTLTCLVPSLAPTNPAAVCAGGSVLLTASPAGGTSYTWLKDGVEIQGATSVTYSATETGSYTVKVNATGYSGAASNAVQVTVNDCTPTAVDDNFTTNEDTPLNGDVSTNDTPSGDGGNVWSLVGANGGAQHGTVVLNTDGSFTYTPAADYNGSDAFTYQLCDADNDCSSATVFITINSVNDPPVAGTATAAPQTNPGGTISVPVNAALFSGTDIDGTIQSLTITEFPVNATSITIHGMVYTSETFPVAGVTVPTNSTGQPTQTISVDPVDGNSELIIQYKVTDNAGAASSNTGYVTIPFTIPPDLAPNITVAPNVMNGITNFYITVQVTELNSIATNGLITVLIPKDARVSFTYDPALTGVGFTNVNNSAWSYDAGNQNYHVFTSNTAIAAGGSSVFGMIATFNPLNSRGVYTVTSTIVSGSGGEIKTSNNSDAEIINYFPGN